MNGRCENLLATNAAVLPLKMHCLSLRFRTRHKPSNTDSSYHRVYHAGISLSCSNYQKRSYSLFLSSFAPRELGKHCALQRQQHTPHQREIFLLQTKQLLRISCSAFLFSFCLRLPVKTHRKDTLFKLSSTRTWGDSARKLFILLRRYLFYLMIGSF